MTLAPYNIARAITPSDTVDLGPVGTPLALCSAVYVGGAGVVAVVLEDGTVVNVTAIAGGLLPVRARRVNATNTTATLLVALYHR